MIATFTGGSDRRRLKFAETVVREFGFVKAYGFRQVRGSATFVRYESDRLFLNVFHGRGSYEIGIELGRLSSPELHYRLPVLVAALVREPIGQTVFQASNLHAVKKCVVEVARILKEFCGAALAGDSEAFRLIEKAAEAESERVTLHAQFSAIIDRADQAWEAKELDLATSLYQKAQPALDEARSRRLEYLLGRTEKS